ncbi:MAG: HEAT repeat domain-containing protein [Candidatus Poribacteria bacterium]
MKCRLFVVGCCIIVLSLAMIDCASHQVKIEPLIIQLGNEDAYIASKAVDRLVKIGNPAVPELIKALSVPNKGNRHHLAMKTLANIGEPVVPVLIEAMKNKDADIRQGAVLGLSHMSYNSKLVEPAIPELTNALEDQDIRQIVVNILGNIGKPAVPALIKALSSDDSSIGANAAFYLRKIGTPEAKKAVEEWQKSQR